MLTLPKSSVEVTEDDMKESFPPTDILQKWYNGEDVVWPPEPELQELRFDLGTQVLCRVGPADWLPGRVVQLWYREKDWPEFVFAPYKIQLSDGRCIFAPQDMDQIIRLDPNPDTNNDSKTNNNTINMNSLQSAEEDDDDNNDDDGIDDDDDNDCTDDQRQQKQQQQ
jgi:hypothetical protein